jgi:putative two-component system response regulator
MDDGEYLQCCAEIARSHHEKYDGKGYPDGLKGDEIPISAQIVSVADVYDALISERCYKKAYLKNVAFEMILRGECGVFNPKIMESFAKLKDEFEMLADKLQ